MGFVNLIAFILNFTKKSLQIELDNFFTLTQGTNQTVSKQAFSQARQKVSPQAFIILFQAIVNQFYQNNDFKTYRGYRLSAIDGSTVELQNTEALRNVYGYAENTTVKVARAKVSGLYDLGNHLLIDAIIDRYDVDEEILAYRHIERLRENGLRNDLILFDRGYPSKALITRLTEAKINFVMRVSSHFIKEVNQVKSQDEIVAFWYKGQTYRIRVLKFMLSSGVEEILISSLLEPSFTIDDFMELYFKRWGIETKYNELKHRLEIENFTGETPITVEQDFYASMYLSNMAALAKMDSDEQIQERNHDKNLKYEYQTNMNILIGKLKDRLILMILEPSSRRRKKVLDQLMREIARNAVPIRPGRTHPRIKKTNRDRYPMNQKKSL
ncbi:DDE family transposase [Hydrogenispora ethanolica]|uniref:DDE family transposase n=2 Tax=Hydrogenispora ethanolica TaxID=1082276 RepID=A0A4R1QKK9_HYDET|nr:DDE family transposase [Hydrogenispora ethanolica]